MANLRLSTASANAAMDSVTILINAGSAGTIKIYDGTQPADANTAVSTQNLLGTLTFSADAFADAIAGVSTANVITEESNASAGTASWARIESGTPATVFDCDVGEAADNATITLNSKIIGVDGTIEITAFELTHPDGV